MTRHRFDTFSALAGAACLSLAAAVTLRTGPLGLAELRLIGPLVVLALGISLLASGGRVARVEHASPSGAEGAVGDASSSVPGAPDGPGPADPGGTAAGDRG